MLAGISPLGERARGNRWWHTAAAYGVGNVAGGAVLGGVLGGAGALVAAVLGSATIGEGVVGLGGDHGQGRLVLAAAFAVVAGLADLLAPRRVPTLHRQVDETWLGRYRGWVYGVAFGAQLGAGAMTIVSTATVYAWMAAAVLGGSVTGGVVVGAVFGAARALPLLLVARVDSPAALRELLRRLSRQAAIGRAGAAATSLAVGVGWAAAALVRS